MGRVLERREGCIRTFGCFHLAVSKPSKHVSVVFACEHEVHAVNLSQEYLFAFAQLLYLSCKHYDHTAGFDHSGVAVVANARVPLLDATHVKAADGSWFSGLRGLVECPSRIDRFDRFFRLN